MDRKPGRISFFLGVGLLGVALVVTFLLGALMGTPLALAALALVVHGLTTTGRKAADKPCAACPRRIVFEHEAEFCERCDRPVHAACVAQHLAMAHKVEGGHPSR